MCVYVCGLVWIGVCVCVDRCVCVYVCGLVWIGVCVCVCVCVCVNVFSSVHFKCRIFNTESFHAGPGSLGGGDMTSSLNSLELP